MEREREKERTIQNVEEREVPSKRDKRIFVALASVVEAGSTRFFKKQMAAAKLGCGVLVMMVLSLWFALSPSREVVRKYLASPNFSHQTDGSADYHHE